MPAKSLAQKRLFSMAYAYKKGELKVGELPDAVRDDVVQLADDMSMEQLKDFASTKEEGLPNKVSESVHVPTFSEFVSTQYYSVYDALDKVLESYGIKDISEFLQLEDDTRRNILADLSIVRKF